MTQTPPYPIANPMRFLIWSEKTRRVWNFVPPSALSKMTIRSQVRVHEPVAVHRVVLGDPEPAVRVPRELDGILHIGLRREDAGLETGRELHLGNRLGGRLRRRAGAAGHGIGVENLRELGGAQGGHGGGDAAQEQEGTLHSGRSRFTRTIPSGPAWIRCA